MSGITQLVQIAPAFAIPVLAARRASQLDLLAVIVGTALAGLLGVLLVPGAALLWMVFLGIGQGGALGLALMLPVLRGQRPRRGRGDGGDGDGRRLSDRRRRPGAGRAPCSTSRKRGPGR